jgi:hypothetical protein
VQPSPSSRGQSRTGSNNLSVRPHRGRRRLADYYTEKDDRSDGCLGARQVRHQLGRRLPTFASRSSTFGEPSACRSPAEPRCMDLTLYAALQHRPEKRLRTLPEPRFRDPRTRQEIAPESN